MKRIEVASRLNQDWSGKFVDDDSYDVLLDEDAVVHKPGGGFLLALKKRHHSPDAMKSAWSVLQGFNSISNNRGVAAGFGRVRNVKQDGTVSNTNRTPKEGEVKSGTVGYMERSPRFPYCRACAWNLESPERLVSLNGICREASELYREFGGAFYEKQERHALKTHPDFIIPGTIFTTLTVNKNFRTACHKDAGNLTETLNVMSLFRTGKFSGGNIVFPDFRVAAKLDTGDCIVFDAHEFHGNTQVVQLSKEFTRCTVVFYFREGMDLCRSAAEELEIVKRRQKGQAMFEEDSE